MSGHAPILDNPRATAEELAARIVALPRDERPAAMANAQREFLDMAKQAGRTDGEATYFAQRMGEIVAEAIECLAGRLGS